MLGGAAGWQGARALPTWDCEAQRGGPGGSGGGRRTGEGARSQGSLGLLSVLRGAQAGSNRDHVALFVG